MLMMQERSKKRGAKFVCRVALGRSDCDNHHLLHRVGFHYSTIFEVTATSTDTRLSHQGGPTQTHSYLNLHILYKVLFLLATPLPVSLQPSRELTMSKSATQNDGRAAHRANDSGWNKLPEEIKLEIFNIVLATHPTESSQQQFFCARHFLSPLVRTNKEFCRLALATYASVTHTFSPSR